MTNRPSVPEIITVNSEDLQATIRDLLPSQNGFGSELQATNVITPIIDLTATAEGSNLPSYLQTALAFGSQTAFDVSGTTTALASSAGFYRVVGSIVFGENGTAPEANFQINDGSTSKIIIGWQFDPSGVTRFYSNTYDFTVWLRPTDTLNAVSNVANAFLTGSIRQVATGDGTLVQPVGYPL